jgi:hypothetical protein
MSDHKVGANPYVGPRPFRFGEPLFGRDFEARDLFYLLNAERIVLLHSPSGAGKSSLISAGLIPRLKQEEFDVWPVIRVNLEPPANATVNRYVLSTILSLEEELPENLRRGSEALHALTLDQYVSTRPRRRGAPPNLVLIFDQFEEVLTVDPVATECKRQFFTQLGELLRRREVWALFVAREDYLAPFDPYASLIPTQLRNRFRLDLLGLDAAVESVRKPAQAAGRDYGPDVAEQLVRDLSAVSVQQVDGTFVKQNGHTVEPVQLQVVCRRLWDEMPADDFRVDPEDLERFGDVNNALGAYYDLSVKGVAAGDRFLERQIRDWFNDKLIVRGEIRGQTMQGEAATDELDNQVIRHLLNTHLIRSEKRRAATWYELAHDRLIRPVLQSNNQWYETNLEEFQRRGALWEKSGSDGLLLVDGDLKKAEAWVQEFRKTTPEEDRFLAASRQRQEIVEKEKRHLKKLRWRSILASVAALIALFLFFVTGVTEQKLQAEYDKHKNEAQRREEDLKARFDLEKRTMLALSKLSAAEMLTAQQRVGRDRAFLDLLTGVLRFPITVVKGSQPGEVAAANPEWVTLITGMNGKPFAIARAVDSSTKGRIIAVGHDSFLVYRDANYDNQPLGTMLVWLKGDRPRKVLISAKPTDAMMMYAGQPELDRLAKKIHDWQFETEFASDPADRGKLAKAGVLILGNAWADFTDAEISAITDFVDNGGGILAVGIGWSWMGYGPNGQDNKNKPAPLDAYPMNKLFAHFGARWTDQMVAVN